jgi:hypothetical protein
MRNVLATLLGFVVGSALVYTFETLLGQSLFPLPEGSDPTNLEWIKNNMHLIPTGAKLFVVLAHFVGIIGGMFIAGLISKNSLIPAYIVGGILFLATLFNVIYLPKELWFTAADLVGVIVGFILGRQLAKQRIIPKV